MLSDGYKLGPRCSGKFLLCAGQIILPLSLPGAASGLEKNFCDKQGRGIEKKEWLECLYRAGQGQNKVIRRPGQRKKGDVPGGARGDGGKTT